MSIRVIDLTGQKFTRLTVISRAENNKNGQARWLCKCDCGNETIVKSDDLKRGKTKSCGCLRVEVSRNRMKVSSVKHNKTKHPLYSVWTNMKSRCYTPTDNEYKNYGVRGIKVCDEWREDFMAFYNWAFANGYKKGLSIDRINNDGDYEPNNCRWATVRQQINNRRCTILLTYKDRTLPLAEWATVTGINYCTLYKRYQYEWSTERILTTPKGRYTHGI